MGFNIRGGDKSSLALLSSKRGRAFARTRADEAFALPSFSDAMPAPIQESQQRLSNVARPEQPAKNDAENVKQTMLEHESVFKEQLHELHRLYQKQRVLMTGPKSEHFPDQISEAPSSNSSLLWNPETKLQEGRSVVDMNSVRDCGSSQTCNSIFERVDDVVRPQSHAFCQNENSQVFFGIDVSAPKLDRNHVFSSEQPTSRPLIIDLERPAEEYMDVEVQEEKPQFAGLTCKLTDAFRLPHSHFLGGKKSGELREKNLGAENSVPKNNKLFGFEIVCNTRLSDSYNNFKEDVHKVDRKQDQFISNHPTSNFRYPHEGPSTVIDFQRTEYVSSHASGFSQNLPDLNADVSLTEEGPSSMPTLSAEYVKLKEEQHIDLESDSKACSNTSGLPHWLCQAPLAKSSPSHFSAKTSDFGPKTSVFLHHAHDETVKHLPFPPLPRSEPSWCSNSSVGNSNISVGIANSQLGQESSSLLPQTSTNLGHGKFSHMVSRAFSSELFYSRDAYASEVSYAGIHGVDYRSRGDGIFCSQPRDEQKISISAKLPNSFSGLIGIQGVQFERGEHSAEPFSKVDTAISGKFSNDTPLYHHGQSFSQLLQHGFSQEPLHNPSNEANLWGMPQQGQQAYFKRVESSIHDGLDHARITSGSLSHSRSSTGNHASDCIHAAPMSDVKVQESQFTSYKQIVPSEVPLKKSSIDLNLSGDLIDLNVSSEEFMHLDNIGTSHVNNILHHTGHQKDFNQRSELGRNTSWQTLNSSRESDAFEQQEKSSTCFKSSTNDVAFGLSIDANTTHSHCKVFHMPKVVDNSYLARDTFRNGSLDYYSGDETGGGLVGGKSSDGSGLTSCGSRELMHFRSTKTRDDSITSSGGACQSHESVIHSQNGDAASISLQRKRNNGLLFPASRVHETYQLPFLSPSMEGVPLHHDFKEDCFTCDRMDCDDESESTNPVAKEDLTDAAEAAALLLNLGLDPPVKDGDQFTADGLRNCLNCLADAISDEDSCPRNVLNAESASREKDEVSSSMENSAEVTAAKALDSFELAVLALKPIDPNSECLATPSLDGHNCIENIPTLRRRPSRRGRAGKDFQKDMLRNMVSLSRHDAIEDLQIIEGLIESAPAAMSLSSPQDDSLPAFEQGSSSLTTWKDSKLSRLPATPNMRLWGESTRRKRMGRQRSQWLSLPLGVRLSIFPEYYGNYLS
ncbi:hypothetical protein KP509_29G017200 [Ceratopteris richardii]|nr:hypothetical protein KP509_29G017200 [Ceratopteris richardii]KAH7291447.1 hypothetical protein KP509_29G017200 [Ceratopteris richardii]